MSTNRKSTADDEERLRARLKRRQETRRERQGGNSDNRRLYDHRDRHYDFGTPSNHRGSYGRQGPRDTRWERDAGPQREDRFASRRSRSRSASVNSYRGNGDDSRSSRSSRSRSRSRSSRSSSYSSRSSRSRSSSTSGDDSKTAAAPLTKDQRTVFVSQLVMRATERDLKKYFKAKSLKINDIIMLRDRRTGRHKGCAYVELRELDDVPKAVLLSHTAPDFQKFPLLIKASEAEKNYVAAAAATLVTAVLAPPTIVNGVAQKTQKVYLGNLDPRVNQEQLYTLFSNFGVLESVQLQVDTITGQSRGFCFLGYQDARDANLAIQTMAGQLLAGRPIKTGWATAGAGVISSTEFPTNATFKIKEAHKTLALLTGAGLTAEFSVDSLVGTVVDAKVIGNVETPTCIVLVHNMFDKDEETDEGWDEDIRLDFEDECAKFGKIVNVLVMSKEPGGKIYTTFSNTSEAKACASNLAGRWFDKRQLRVEFVEALPKVAHT